MTRELLYALGSLGGLLLLFGAFLLLWRRYQCAPRGCSIAPRTPGAIWAVLLLGGALAAWAALLLATGP